ncbi:MAG: 4Fe-4S dicluster domain-containing protein [Clostridia bacterium]|nr:4Fe-4S dicluster domain-containing protein [Clostridia bacterium]
MIANYGYEDGSGHYYIKIDTSKCAECENKACITVCPEKLFATELDDFDDEVVIIREEVRHTLATNCANCKRQGGTEPCIKACPEGAITLSW